MALPDHKVEKANAALLALRETRAGEDFPVYPAPVDRLELPERLDNSDRPALQARADLLDLEETTASLVTMVKVDRLDNQARVVHKALTVAAAPWVHLDPLDPPARRVAVLRTMATSVPSSDLSSHGRAMVLIR